MRIGIAWQSKNRKGGGWSFTEQLSVALQEEGIEVVNPLIADTTIIPSASVITKDYFNEIRSKCKRVILRVDNALRNSRNRGCGMNNLRHMSLHSDLVIFQGRWARDFLKDYIAPRKYDIIHNGIDLDIYQPYKRISSTAPVYLFSCASKGESKGWHKVWYRYQEIHKQNPESQLLIVGDMPQELKENNFDFFNGEKVTYLGFIQDRKEMVRIYNQANYLFASYDYDCFSQTYLEALCCGMKLFEPSMTGGTPEIIELWNKHGREYFDIERMIKEYIAACRGFRKFIPRGRSTRPIFFRNISKKEQ